MSAEAAILTRSWRVGSRTASLSVPRPQPGKPLHVCIEWDPAPPSTLSDRLGIALAFEAAQQHCAA